MIIRQAYERAQRPMISVSLGKDSTVMLDLAKEVAREMNIDVPAILVIVAETLTMYNFPELIEHYKKSHQLQVRDITEFLQETGKRTYAYFSKLEEEFDVSLVGVRKLESKRREWAIKKYGVAHKKQNGHTNAYPMAYWTTEDIELYIRGKGLPYNDKYRVLGFSERVMGRIRDGEEKIKHNLVKNAKLQKT